MMCEKRSAGWSSKAGNFGPDSSSTGVGRQRAGGDEEEVGIAVVRTPASTGKSPDK